MAMSSFIAALPLLLSFFNHIDSSVLTKARELEDDLFLNYRRFVKPRVNRSEAVVVTYTSRIQQLVEVEVETQRVSLIFWMIMFWTDDFLAWNKTEYEDLSTIYVNPIRIWIPDIVVANRQDTNPVVEEVTQIQASVSHTGAVTWFKPISVTVPCNMNTRKFPWDQQTCIFRIASYTHFDHDIKIDLKGLGGGTNIVEHPEWSLVETEAFTKVYKKFRNEVTNKESDKTVIEFNVVFERKPRFYVIIIVIPTILISIVSMFVFLLPNSSSEKITFSMSMMLSFYINLLTVANNIPNTSQHYPFIGYYYLACIFLIATSLFQTALTLTLHFKNTETTRAPLWLRQLAFDSMKLIVKIKCLRHALPGDLINRMNDPEVETPKTHAFKIKSSTDDTSVSELQLKRFLAILNKFDEHRFAFDTRQHSKQMQSKIIAEWQLIAKVLDILIGFLFFLMALFLSIGVLLMSTFWPL